MSRARWPLLAVLALLAGPVPAQENSAIEDLRPKGARFPDNMGIVDLPIGPVPAEFAAAAANAETISDAVFGPRVDAAYGAFQRGFYLTALSLALPRAETGDKAAQTLIGEIYSKGLGVAENP